MLMVIRDFQLLMAMLEREKRDLLLKGAQAEEINIVEEDLFFVRKAFDVFKRRFKLQRHPRRGVIDSTSSTGMARAILRDHDGPLHVDVIIERLWHRYEKSVKKASLTSRLSKLAKRGEVFTLLRPGTYGLTEWSDRLWKGLDSETVAPQGSDHPRGA